MILSAMAGEIKQQPNQGKEKKAEELIKNLLVSVLGKKMSKANVGASMAMEVDNNHEAIAKVAIGQLQSILGKSNKHRRRDRKGSKDK